MIFNCAESAVDDEELFDDEIKLLCAELLATLVSDFILLEV